MLSKDFQVKMVLPFWKIPKTNFTDFQYHNITGVRNFYVKLNDEITLGVWHILPESYVDFKFKYSDYDYEYFLENTSLPVLLYFHGNGRVRSGSVEMYKILRKFFHVISFDYRGYGDSSKSELTEEHIVNDCVALYKWLLSNIKNSSSVFFWGHSIGSGVATITISKLALFGLPEPVGLFLETPFTSSRDVIVNSQIGKVYSWLPWFEKTILEPVEKNGLGFNVATAIEVVTCPVMMMHAADDTVIPYSLGRKVRFCYVETKFLFCTKQWRLVG